MMHDSIIATTSTATTSNCRTTIINDDLSIQEKAKALFQNSEILAPMVRASTTPLRTLALHYGADLVFTEEIVDRAITTKTERIHNTALDTIDYVRKLDSFSPKVQRRIMAAVNIASDKNKSKNNNHTMISPELPVVLRIAHRLERGRLVYQMGTGEANLALEAAKTVYADVDGFDINMGCPKKVGPVIVLPGGNTGGVGFMRVIFFSTFTGFFWPSIFTTTFAVPPFESLTSLFIYFLTSFF